MGDIDSIQNQILTQKEQYDQTRRELKDKQNREIENIRKSYAYEIQKTKEEGEAAVNHIRKEVRDRIDMAEKNAQEANKAVDEESSRTEQKNYQRRAEREKYFKEFAEKQNEWAKAEEQRIRDSKNSLVEGHHKELEEISNKNRETAAKLKEQISKESQEYQAKGREQIIKTRDDYARQKEKVDAQGRDTLKKATEVYDKTLEAENKRYHETTHNLTENHKVKIEELREKTNAEANNAHKKAAKLMENENHEAEVRLKNVQDEHDKEFRAQRDKYEFQKDKMREENQKEITRIDAQTKKELTETKTQFDKKTQEQKRVFTETEKKQADLHEYERKKLESQNLAEIDRIKTNYQKELLRQQDVFEKKFRANDEYARAAYANQTLTLGRELLAQKNQFIKESDKYANKQDDPFYQIRDNRTRFTETDNAYILEAHVPEHEKEDVQLKVKGDKIILQGSRSFNDDINNGVHRINTNNVQTFREEYGINKKVYPEKSVRFYEGGILKVIVPKA